MSSLADPFARALCAAVTEVGPHELTWIGDPERIAAMQRGGADIGWVCGLLYLSLKAEGPWPFTPLAAPVMAADRYRGRPVYFGDVVVAAGSELTTFESLAGTVFAYNETASWSGCRMMADRLASRGRDLGWFGARVESGSHLASIDLVASGTASCAVIDSTVLEMAGRAGVDVRGIRVIDHLGPYPAPPFLIHEAIPDAIRRDVVQALEQVASHGMVADWAVAAFAPVSGATYARWVHS